MKRLKEKCELIKKFNNLMWKKNLTKFFFHLKHKNKEMFKSLRIKYFKISYFSLSLNVSVFLKNIINNGIVKMRCLLVSLCLTPYGGFKN